ncbi:hypothetical protein TNCV_1659331 [Trichonephila clavipes]|nr:hypothetical protein TNCV_1659331 [Trichonephila clavipes]
MGIYITVKRRLSERQLPERQISEPTAAQENQRPFSKKTKVYIGTACVRFHILHGSHSVFGYPNNRVSERCLVQIYSDKRRSTASICVLDESRSFFRVHTGYFSNIPKCIKAEFIASWGCSQSSVVSSSQR